ncbi:MAG: CAP domain-containing protein, partial [Oscillospiraceae bacterium]
EPELPSEPETPAEPELPSEPEQPEVSDGVHAYERQVVELVNVQRARNGLQPLSLDAELCRFARVKSQDMHDNRYFDHTSPTYGSPFDMMRQFGITYASAGENIAMGYSTPEAVVNAWMNSSGHRANILSTKYTTLGVGFVSDGGYWTQWFIG